MPLLCRYLHTFSANLCPSFPLSLFSRSTLAPAVLLKWMPFSADFPANIDYWKFHLAPQPSDFLIGCYQRERNLSTVLILLQPCLASCTMRYYLRFCTFYMIVSLEIRQNWHFVSLQKPHRIYFSRFLRIVSWRLVRGWISFWPHYIRPVNWEELEPSS